MRHDIDFTGLLMAMVLQAVHDYVLLKHHGIIKEDDSVVQQWPKRPTKLILKCNRPKEVFARFANYYEHRTEVQMLIEFVKMPSIQNVIRHIERGPQWHKVA